MNAIDITGVRLTRMKRMSALPSCLYMIRSYFAVFSDLFFTRLHRLISLSVLFDVLLCSVCMVHNFSVSVCLVIEEMAQEWRTFCSVKYSVCLVV